MKTWKDRKPQLMLPTCEASEGTSSKTPAYTGQRGSTRSMARRDGPTTSTEITDIFEFMQPFDMRNFPFDTPRNCVRVPPVEMANYNPCTLGLG